jgi:hypothetical protein
VERKQEKKHWFVGPEGSWSRSIRNMVKQGAKLNKAEEEILVECLSKPHPDVLSLCKLDNRVNHPGKLLSRNNAFLPIRQIIHGKV